MLFRDRPLLVDGVDRDLYLPRPALERRVIEPVLAWKNVLLLGDAGSGKSTLLRKLAIELEARGRPTVTVRAAVAESLLDLLQLLDAELERRVARDSPRAERDGLPDTARLVDAARALARDAPAVILLDGLDEMADPGVGYDLFGRLRDELWGLGHAWIVTARTQVSGSLRTPPAAAFWSVVVEIPPLNDEERDELIDRGLTEPERELAADRLPLRWEGSAVHPRLVIRTVEELLSAEASDATEREPWDWHLMRARELGRSEEIALMELIGLGRPASAHDRELLARLGWSRPYAQRVLSNLERSGVVRSIAERRDEPGRPRKLYEPITRNRSR
jgi:type II secretory pathway predicted ATPase ExeA